MAVNKFKVPTLLLKGAALRNAAGSSGETGRRSAPKWGKLMVNGIVAAGF